MPTQRKIARHEIVGIVLRWCAYPPRTTYVIIVTRYTPDARLPRKIRPKYPQKTSSSRANIRRRGRVVFSVFQCRRLFSLSRLPDRVYSRRSRRGQTRTHALASSPFSHCFITGNRRIIRYDGVSGVWKRRERKRVLFTVRNAYGGRRTPTLYCNNAVVLLIFVRTRIAANN